MSGSEAAHGAIEKGNVGDEAVTWAHAAALIKTAVAFEHLMLDCIVTAINNDTSTISARTGIKGSCRPLTAARPASASTASTPSHAWTSCGRCAIWDWTFLRSGRSWTGRSRFPTSPQRQLKRSATAAT
jgi:hypothetical protein